MEPRGVTFTRMMSRAAGRGGLTITFVAAACAFFVLLLSSSANAAYPGTNGRIAFASDEGSFESDIYSILPSGAGLINLTHNSFNEFAPAWSADGKRITYVRPVGQRYQVFMMNADGTNQRRVSFDGTTDSSPGFSPNGGRIVYSRAPRTGGRSSIVTVRKDGTDLRIVVAGFGQDPQYSPGGHWVVFSGSGSIWRVHPNGTVLQRLTDPPPDRFDIQPDWKPDGEQIAFRRCAPSGMLVCSGDLYVMNRDGSGVKVIPGDEGDEQRDRPAFSPDGHRIATTGAAGPECSDIFTISRIGTNFRWVTDNCDSPFSEDFAAWPSWRPLFGG
jgi:Tol biopolymer transport system component